MRGMDIMCFLSLNLQWSFAGTPCVVHVSRGRMSKDKFGYCKKPDVKVIHEDIIAKAKDEQIKSLTSQIKQLNDDMKFKVSENERLTSENKVLYSQLQEAKDEMAADSCFRSCEGLTIQQVPLTSENGTVTYRDVSIDDGNWTVFQRRLNGELRFVRYWDEYVDGFGSVCGEHWLGLEALHQLTINGDQELRIDMAYSNGAHFYAKYSSFTISSKSQNYRIQVSGFSGNVTKDALMSDGFGTTNKMQFSTYDVDNDGDPRAHCARSQLGGWWHRACTWANLNGVYGSDSFNWFGTRLRFVEMKMRKKA